MPYGLPKEIDTPEMNAKMERCVSDIQKKGKDKESAIKICKAQMMKASESKQFAEWSTAFINDLPDSCFAYISSGGKKDSDGKTTPRSLRHLPYKDADGKPDLAHVRNALARLEHTQIPEEAKPGIKKKLEDILGKEKASDRFVGVFPFEFSEPDMEEGDDGVPSMIHLIPIGQWDHEAYGPITITMSDINEFCQNFNAQIRKGVPITAGHEGMSELPAVGWITKVEARDTGLWGEVEWTDTGRALLCDKAFKFFSPEFYRDYEDPETHQIYRNVITGGALTKSPYFKELEAVVFSEFKIKNNFNDKNTMEINEIVAKDIITLTDDEKAFLKEHTSELTEEQKTSFASVIEEPVAGETDEERVEREAKEKADEEAKIGAENEAKGFNPDGSEKVSASEKVMISAGELAILRSKADAGQKAFAELQKQKMDVEVSSLMFSESNKKGKFLPKSKDSVRAFMESLNDKQRSSFSALVAELPTAGLFSEKGDGNDPTNGLAMAEVENKVKAKMSENKDIKYSQALKEVMSENAGLEERYDRELPSATKKNA